MERRPTKFPDRYILHKTIVKDYYVNGSPIKWLQVPPRGEKYVEGATRLFRELLYPNWTLLKTVVIKALLSIAT